MKYYKILVEKEKHNGLQFRGGRVDDPNEFQETGSCVPGGIYFAPATSILAFVDIGPWIREVTVPDDAQMVRDPGTGIEKYRASSVVLGPRRRWASAEMLQKLVDEGADIHIENGIVLCWAALNGSVSAVKYLIEQGLDIHTKEDSALCWAAEEGHLNVVKYLVEQGADIHAQGDHALCWGAASYGHLDVVKYLVEHGADIHAQEDDALYFAVMYNHLDVVIYLVEHGANTYIQNYSAIQCAIDNKSREVLYYLKSIEGEQK